MTFEQADKRNFGNLFKLQPFQPRYFDTQVFILRLKMNWTSLKLRHTSTTT